MLAGPRANLGSLFRGAMVVALAGAVYRFDTYLVAFNPGPGWHYFPSVPEMFISFGLIAIELADLRRRREALPDSRQRPS